MRKYQQLVLIILSFLSFSCLLIYRHEYNKLHYVLEVLNFFGSPGKSVTSSSNCTDINATRVLARLPLPTWQRISDSFYVYSAFWEKLDRSAQVKAYGIGTHDEKMNYRCYLWYDQNPKTKLGVFKFSEFALPSPDIISTSSSNSKTKPFIIYCKPQSDFSTVAPVAVTFFHQNLSHTNFGTIPVFNLKQSNFLSQNSTGICIMPTDSPEFNKSMYLQFLNFHNIIGIDNFFIYGGINHYSLLSSTYNNKNNNPKIAILPWNYPFHGEHNIMKIIAEEDCRRRFKGLIDNLIILEWNKFLVPRYLFNISKLLNELDKEKNVNKFLFSVLLFCTDFKDEATSNISLPIIFRKIRYIQSKVYAPVPLYKPDLEFGKTQKIKKSIIAVHQYATCGNYKLKWSNTKNVDTTMLKFKNEFFESQVMKI